MTAECQAEAMSFAIVNGSNVSLARADVAEIRALIESHGAILLRGFETTLEDLAALGDSLCSASVFNESPHRERMGDEGRVQSVNLGDAAFPLHPELAREPWRPDLAMFACLDPPSVSGQTNVCDGIAIAQHLPAELRNALEGKRLVYMRPASPELLRFWLGTESPDDQLLAHPPATCPYWFRRSARGIMRGFFRPALERPLFDERPAFANFLLFARDFLRIRHIPLLEGEIFDDEVVDVIRSTARSLTRSHRWMRGDVILLDNSRYMHGRRAIANADERRIATYFGYLKGIDRREGEPADPIWRRKVFVPPEKPSES